MFLRSAYKNNIQEKQSLSGAKNLKIKMSLLLLQIWLLLVLGTSFKENPHTSAGCGLVATTSTQSQNTIATRSETTEGSSNRM